MDGVTPVDASRLDKIEAGIVAAEESAKKAQPNGYASLDSGGKVPLAQLPPVGADLVYNGTYVPATPYEDGDVVVYNGIAYMAVKATSAAPVAWPGGPTPAAPQTIPYGTSLPASPADGQEAILVDSVTNPTYTWRFRFNSLSSSAYKWEFVGGAPVFGYVEGPHSVTSTTFVDLTGGPSITLPRSGDYEVAHGFTARSTTAAVFAISTLSVSGAVPVTAHEIASVIPNTNNYVVPMRRFRVDGITGSRIVKVQYRVSAGTVEFLRRDLVIAPVRVS